MCCCLCCCCSLKCCSSLAAIYSLVESVVFASTNLVLIFAYTCTIAPPCDDHISSGELFIEKAWSWFFYDEANCVAKEGSEYEAPPWILDIPSYFDLSSAANNVTPEANYGYQISYFIIHCLWGLSAIPFLVAALRKRPAFFVPWLVMGSLLTGLDTVVGAFYIKLMDDTEPGWDDGRAMFAMQFLYFRGFLLYGLNITALIFVFVNFCGVSCKRYKDRRNKLKHMTNLTIETSVVTSPGRPTNPPYETTAYEIYSTPAGQPQGSRYVDYVEPPKQPAPTKYRPFSYTNPAYRPADPHDIEGMKTNSPGPAIGQPPSPSVNLLAEEGSYYQAIPRVSIKKV